MIKTILAVILVTTAVIVIAIFALLAIAWWVSLRQPPGYALIVEKYHVCTKQKALHGGIFGKGPTKRFFPEKSRKWCWRWEWSEVSADEFKYLASKWYGVDWSKEADWWRQK